MIKAPRVLWVVVLALFVGGCSSARPARWSDAPREAGEQGSVLPVVEIGDKVTVARLDGTRVSGRLSALADESVTVKVERKAGYLWVREDCVIPRADISSVKKRAFSVKRSLGLFGAVVGGLGATFLATLDWE